MNVVYSPVRGAVQLVQNRCIKNKNRKYLPAGGESLFQPYIILYAQIPSIPKYNNFTFHQMNKRYQLNLTAFAGLIFVITILGTINADTHTSNVPELSNSQFEKLSSIGTVFR